MIEGDNVYRLPERSAHRLPATPAATREADTLLLLETAVRTLIDRADRLDDRLSALLCEVLVTADGGGFRLASLPVTVEGGLRNALADVGLLTELADALLSHLCALVDEASN
jgi:hypothetical protein